MASADTPIIRVEQLYPFPSRQLAAELARYPNLKTVVWCQEESRNQGAWSFIEPQLRELLPSSARLSYAGPARIRIDRAGLPLGTRGETGRAGIECVRGVSGTCVSR